MESEEQFRGLAEHIPQLAWMANADGGIFWYNQRWYDYTGTTPKDMEGWGWQSVHDPKVLPEVMERWKASLTSPSVILLSPKEQTTTGSSPSSPFFKSGW